MGNDMGKKILVTGASSGIGRCLAKLLAENGDSVVLVARNSEELEKTRGMMKNPERHICISADITDASCYAGLFDRAVSDGKKLGGLVHSAGISKVTPLRGMSPDKISEIFNINFNAFLILVSYYAKNKYSDGGSIVGISSANAHYPQKCMSVYAASKAALEAAVRTMAIELNDKHIRINAVIPGAVNTEMTSVIDKDALDAIYAKQLLGCGEPIQIAKVIRFLLEDDSSFITGRALYADGGLLGQ